MFVSLKNVNYQVPNGQPVYENLNIELYQGDFFGILGKNGAGKTTLIDLLMGYRPVTSGEILVMGEDPMSVHRRRKSQIFILSHDISIQQSHKVSNYLDFTSFFYKNYDKDIEARLLKYFDIDINAKFGSLSTGQKVKAQIVAAVASRAKLILIDEVTAVLDPESRKKFFVVLKQMKKEGLCSVIMATNIAEDLDGIVDKVIFIDRRNVQVYPVKDVKDLFNLDDVSSIEEHSVDDVA